MLIKRIIALSLAFTLLIPGSILTLAAADTITYDPFKIRVVDSETGRGIPLVEVKTVNHITYYTDSAGHVSFFEPGLMNEDVFFFFKSDGYIYNTNDMFGYEGKTITVTPGGETTVEMKRNNIAERLYRVTGEGIYNDSVLLGDPTPIDNPVLNGNVMGQDTVQTIEYNGKLYWFWGDTNKPEHPLGNFRTTGATSELPGNGGLDPDQGINFTYFTGEDGFVKKMVPQEEGDPNLAWISGLMTTEDNTGKERLIACYSSLQGLGREVASGVLIWSDEDEQFSERVPFDRSLRWKHPGGQTTLYEDNGKEYWLFSDPWPVKRVINNFDDIKNVNSYELFTCLKPGTEYNGENTELNRDANGNLIWEWRTDTPVITQEQEADLISYGLMNEDEAYFQLKDVDTEAPVINHASSVKWNEYRQCWNNIIEETGGTSLLGEIWYAEADSPTGPWTLAKKIVTHNNQDFYNPVRHTYFDKDNGKTIYFEGTYVAMFGGDNPTPRYDYNQIMYKLDLSNQDLGLPLTIDPITPPAEGEFPNFDGLQLRLDASAITGLNNGDEVNTWEDISKNDRDATQSISYMKPTYQTDNTNGKVSVRFDGNDKMKFDKLDAQTVFIVTKVNDGVSDNDGIIGWESQDLGIRRAWNSSWKVNDSFTFTSGSILRVNRVATGEAMEGMWHILTVKRGENTATLDVIGEYYEGRGIEADISEILVYNRPLTMTEINYVEDYLESKWLQ